MKQKHKYYSLTGLKSGFTLIELLIVLAIISILIGVAVPYYNDYIYDARLSTLKHNAAAFRKVLNQFRGDQGRGPLCATYTYSNTYGTETVTADKTFNASYSELVAGPIQYENNNPVRRRNLKYLSAMPLFIDPSTGQPIKPIATAPTVFYCDRPTTSIVGHKFDFGGDFAYTTNQPVGASFTATQCLQLYPADRSEFFDSDGNLKMTVYGRWLPLDYTDIVLEASDGAKY